MIIRMRLHRCRNHIQHHLIERRLFRVVLHQSSTGTSIPLLNFTLKYFLSTTTITSTSPSQRFSENSVNNSSNPLTSSMNLFIISDLCLLSVSSPWSFSFSANASLYSFSRSAYLPSASSFSWRCSPGEGPSYRQ